jgi:hypothetical protein
MSTTYPEHHPRSLIVSAGKKKLRQLAARYRNLKPAELIGHLTEQWPAVEKEAHSNAVETIKYTLAIVTGAAVIANDTLADLKVDWPDAIQREPAELRKIVGALLTGHLKAWPTDATGRVTAANLADMP